MSIKIHIVSKVDGSLATEFYGGSEEHAAKDFMKDMCKSECLVNGKTWFATCGGGAVKGEISDSNSPYLK